MSILDAYTRVSALLEMARTLEETKALHTHKHFAAPSKVARNPRAKALSAIHAKNPQLFAQRRRFSAIRGKSKYAVVKARFEADLHTLIAGYLSGSHSASYLKSHSKEVFERAYRAAYIFGLTAGGSEQAGDNHAAIKKAEQEWVKSSLKQERMYWNKFLTDVVNRDFRRFTPEQRVAMYADTLDHVFETGRMAAQPHKVLVYWKMNPAKEHCDCCSFLEKNSPYTKENLPGVPRDGHTCKGLSRCGCKLLTRVNVDPKYYYTIKRKDRKKLLRQLDLVKKNGSKHGIPSQRKAKAPSSKIKRTYRKTT
jgi:hypothetical protein